MSFVTGASGFIGSAVIPELLGAGHQVVGLARSDAAAASVHSRGAEVHRGALDDLDACAQRRRPPTGSSTWPSTTTSPRVTRRRHESIGGPSRPSAPPWTDRPAARHHIGDARAGAGRVGTEADRPDPPPIAARRQRGGWRSRFATEGCARRRPVSRRRSTAPAITASCPPLIAIARDKGVSAYVGDGANRWPAVTASTRPASSGWRSRTHPPVRCCTPSPTRACRPAPSPRRSVVAWTCRLSRVPPERPQPTSAFSALLPLDGPPRSGDAQNCWVGADTSGAHRRPRRRPLLRRRPPLAALGY